MIAILLFAAFFGGALVLLLARYAPPVFTARPAPGAASDGRSAMSLSQLRSLTVKILTKLGLTPVEQPETDERSLVPTRHDPIGESRYLITLAPEALVDRAAVLQLVEAVKGERSALGMLITPGAIETAGLGSFDVALELIDGPVCDCWSRSICRIASRGSISSVDSSRPELWRKQSTRSPRPAIATRTRP